MLFRFSLLATIVTAGALASSALATTGPDPYAIVKVALTDEGITLSQKSVHDVTYVDFLVHNGGKLPHDFRIGGLATRQVRPGQTVHLVVAFPQYGKYKYASTVHASAKMRGAFQVYRPVTPG
jgi:uncharacterized cupredoxin-like copper-binding protein